MDLQNLYTDPGDEGAAYTLKRDIRKKCQHLINIISQNISGGRFVAPQ